MKEYIPSSPSSSKIHIKNKKRLTMVIDSGLPINSFKDIITTFSSYISLIKLGFGSSLIYSEQILEEKIAFAKAYGIYPYFGGTLFEIFVKGKSIEDYLQFCHQNKIELIEISEGVINLERKDKCRYINQCLDQSFCVITEVGTKNAVMDEEINYEELIQEALYDLELGASKVIFESREGGNLGLYDKKCDIRQERLHVLKSVNERIDDFIFEAPLLHQQAELIKTFGPEVNLGNISPQGIISLECLRRGLRADTLPFINPFEIEASND